MNIWFMLWVFFSVFILGVFFWSLQILMRQKNAWKKFAKRHKMEYIAGSALSSPVVRGAFRGHAVSVYSEPQIDNDSRGPKYRTVVQFDMRPGMPTEGVVSSPKLGAVLSGIHLPEALHPDHPDWNKDIYVRTQSAELLGPYFTEARTRALNSLMTVKNVNVLFIFNEKETLLRFETPDPLDDDSKLERLVNKIADAADILSV